MKKLKQIAAAILLTVLTSLSYTPTVMAAQANSSNYGVGEVRFGSGGELRACSTTYCAKQSAGDLTAGNTGKQQSATLNPSGDAYVTSSTPNTNFGTTNPLIASKTVQRAYFKFNTSTVPAGSAVTSATLRLYSVSAASAAYQIHTTTDSWTEAGLTWNNQPAFNPAVQATTSTGSANSYVTATIPASAITLAANTNFAVDYSAASVQQNLASREDATHPPELILNYSGGTQAVAGSVTNREPLLEVSVTGSAVDLGEMSPSGTSSGSTTFSVKTYLASGYNVYLDGTSPKHKSSGHVLSPMSTQGVSQPGIEQFGINLRQNTTPAIGADPIQVPSGVFSFGAAASGYSASDNFKYVAGDIIASSTSSSGETDYTMSMIANVATTTTGGQYKGRLFLNVVPTF
jgi:hypothetical protein